MGVGCLLRGSGCTGDLDRASGLVYLRVFAKDTRSAANMCAYTNVVRGRSIVRPLIRVGTRLADSALNGSGHTSRAVLAAVGMDVIAFAERGVCGGEGFCRIENGSGPNGYYSIVQRGLAGREVRMFYVFIMQCKPDLFDTVFVISEHYQLLGILVNFPQLFKLTKQETVMFTFEHNGKRYGIHVATPGDRRFAQAKSLVTAVYLDFYQAIIDPNPDLFVICAHVDEACSEEGDHVFACAGMTFGRNHVALFSERYLGRPIETTLTPVLDDRISRDAIVEVGSLASRNGVAGKELIRAIPLIAWFLGMSAILCTATTNLRKILERQQIPFISLAPSGVEQLPPAERKEWGSYYHADPQTGLIRLNGIGHLFESNCGRYTYNALVARAEVQNGGIEACVS